MVKVCFVLLLEQGHLAVCASIGKYLLARDPKNEVIFITDNDFEPNIKRECSQFQTIVFQQPEGCQERHKKRLNNKLDVWKMSNKESFQIFLKNFTSMIELWQSRQYIVRDIVQSIENLDFLFIENLFNLPFLQNLNVKWGLIISTNPLRIGDQVNYPVMSSGTTDPDETREYLKLLKDNSVDFLKMYDEWFEKFGVKKQQSLCFIEGSEYLNVYLYPRPLRYFKPEDIHPGKWYDLQSSICSKEVNEKLKDSITIDKKLPGKELLTPEFLNKPGKLILFSLGTVVTRTIEVFKPIIPLLKDIPHKFVVCKGKFGDQIELPDNCVGANMLDQLELLTVCDLFIVSINGRNHKTQSYQLLCLLFLFISIDNSFCEAMYYGVPIVAIPAFGDQQDNAARLCDLNLGRRLHLANLTKENLSESIEYVLNENDIRKRMAEIGEKIRGSKDGLDEICDLIYKECNQE